MSTAAIEPRRVDALRASEATLRRIAGYTLPQELDRRILELGERKESLNSAERAELMAWVEFSQQRSIDKQAAQAALNRLAEVFPEAVHP